ncbi:peptide-methionine (S)-S-oxide reductase MsrA [Pseudorhodoferax soli]|jgi:peptide-methionine (S)-S-oxide reductase|uniref:Peptide methionine sulfoxide reductase MsrA n=1 Tax=Pseudorhodoferax soli TaxID=545864 RepID=A0A368XRS0_9BURK|nr:peptide-methionine (S)-S-oxide reductase [Pseudorhodoferax soli]
MKNTVTTSQPVLSRRGTLTAMSLLLTGAFAAWKALPAMAAESAVAIPPPKDAGTPAAGATSETAVLAGGCFWGVQGVFQHVKGVTRAVSGYAGGEARTANYNAIGSGSTGHAEAVRITYDPREIGFGQILQIYFSVVHNPTQLNRQGPDFGTQYRSTIFAQSAEQARVAKAYIAQLDQARSFGAPIATTIELAKPFYDAEAYHQDYMTLHPNQPYIAMHDLPKRESLKRVFPDRYRDKPVLVGAST